MAQSDTFSAWINPLSFIELDGHPPVRSAPTPESVLAFVCEPGVPPDVSAFADRYREIASRETRIFAPPSEARILEKLIWPLRHAKASYMVGNYVGTMSLCGMVTEMATIFAFQLAEVQLNQQVMGETEERALSGRTFEKLGQHRRIQIIKAYGLIPDEVATALELIRETRTKYLHFWTKDHDAPEQDAVRVYEAATLVVSKVIGQDIKDGKLMLNPSVIKYLKNRVPEAPDTETEQKEV